MADTKNITLADDPWFRELPERFEAWADELNVGIKKLKIRTADGKKEKAAPNLANRMNRSRLRKGLAFEVRHDLYSALSKLEDMSAPTSTGKLMMGVEDWARIGRTLAALSPKAFEKALAGARAHLDRLESVVDQSPDFEKTEAPVAQPKKAPRAVGRAAISPPKATASGAGDELPWENSTKKSG